MIDRGIVIYIVKQSMVHIIDALQQLLHELYLAYIVAVFFNTTDTSFLWTYDLHSPGKSFTRQVGGVGAWALEIETFLGLCEMAASR